MYPPCRYCLISGGLSNGGRVSEEEESLDTPVLFLCRRWGMTGRGGNSAWHDLARRALRAYVRPLAKITKRGSRHFEQRETQLLSTYKREYFILGGKFWNFGSMSSLFALSDKNEILDWWRLDSSTVEIGSTLPPFHVCTILHTVSRYCFSHNSTNRQNRKAQWLKLSPL